MFDGHVTAEVTIDGCVPPASLFKNNQRSLCTHLSKTVQCKNRATILSAPPHFAHGHHCPTTLFELIEDVYERQKRNGSYDVGEVNFYEHINPLFERMYRNSWSNFRANEGHGTFCSPLLLFVHLPMCVMVIDRSEEGSALVEQPRPLRSQDDQYSTSRVHL